MPPQTTSVRSPVPLKSPVFGARSESPIPPPTDSPNDCIASVYQHHLRPDGKSIHTGRPEFSGVFVRAQTALNVRRLRNRTCHPAFPARVNRVKLAPTERSNSNQPVVSTVPFEHAAVFAMGRQNCESKHYLSSGQGAQRFGKQAGTCGGAGGY